MKIPICKGMDKQFVLWKNIKCPTEQGADVEVGLGDLVDIFCRRTLLSQIIQMPERLPISFDDAIRLLSVQLYKCFKTGLVGKEPGHYGWYAKNFVEWISSQGFHIVLTGDEFESQSMQKHIS